MPDDLAGQYEGRRSLLEHVCHHLEEEAREAIVASGIAYRTSFEVADVAYFLMQAAEHGHQTPLVEVEDQVSGEIAVPDMDAIRRIERELRSVFSVVEASWSGEESETRTLVCVIPPQTKPPGWDDREDVPKTFRLSVTVADSLEEHQDVLPSLPLVDSPIVTVDDGAIDGGDSVPSSDAGFGVFLAHNSKDKPVVEQLARELEKQGIRAWIDSKEIAPGRSFQDAIQEALRSVRAVAICVGEHGIGNWQELEIKSAIALCVNEHTPVIPVLLPGTSGLPESLLFLAEFNWVRFKTSVAEKESVSQLVWGVTGIKPEEISQDLPSRVVPEKTRPSEPSQSGKPGQPKEVVVGLHGIRTHAGWHRALYEVLDDEPWQVRTERWVFGRYNLLQFLKPWSRSAKVKWFREVYDDETKDRRVMLADLGSPSIVAHSFGTYILGNAMLKYDWLCFNKIILCGSILPPDFPWDKLIERGQVQAVRNEYGVQDIWVRLVGWCVADTGPSGHRGFTCRHERLEQEEFDYEHSEYFDKGHIQAKWLPFLEKKLTHLPQRSVSVERPNRTYPWLLYSAYILILILLLVLVVGAYFRLRGTAPNTESQMARVESDDSKLGATSGSEITISFQEFLSEYETAAAKDTYDSIKSFSDLYKGRTFTWSCCIRDIRPDYDEYYVTPCCEDAYDSGDAVIVRFAEGFNSNVPVPTERWISGEVGDIDRHTVALRNCRFAKTPEPGSK